MSSPAIILKSKFVMPEDREFKQYVTYIDRDDAKMNIHFENEKSEKEDGFDLSFDLFMDYMDDSKKNGELFTVEQDSLTTKQKKETKKLFELAEKNGSPLWQDVFSFDNKWLEEQGLYDSENHTVDEKRMKKIIRESVSDLLKAENMEDSAVWTASIHYNTDNIHVHVATVEPFPTREKVRLFDAEKKEWRSEYRGKRKQGSLEKAKSRVVNQIIDRTKDYERIDLLIRGSVHAKNDLDLSTYRKTKKLFVQAISKLPNDLRQWKYGYQTINDARPYIDEIVDIYLTTYHKEEMEELNLLIDEQVKISKQLYGDESKHEKYRKTKIDDLKKRMGNAVLSEMRDYKKNANSNTTSSFHQPIYSNRYHQEGGRFKYSLFQLNKVMRKSYHEYKNERLVDEYDRMLEGRE